MCGILTTRTGARRGVQNGTVPTRALGGHCIEWPKSACCGGTGNGGALEVGPSAIARHAARGLYPLRILFLGDLPEAQLCLSQLQAGDFNAQADVVSHAPKACELLQRVKYHAVIACASAATQTALRTLSALRRRQPGTPFIRLSGSAGPDVVRRFMRGGAFDCLDAVHASQLPTCLAVALEYCSGRDARDVLIRALERSHAEASTDALTGLANYRALRDVLHRESRRSERTGRPFALLVFDLDSLKSINDHHGHPVGNRALCRLAAMLRQSCRSIDTAARCGGDEFAVVLLESTAVSAAMTGRRIREQLAADGERPALSVSVGLASYPQHGPTVDALMGAADRALYEMKRMSREYEPMGTAATLLSAVPLYSDPPTAPGRIHRASPPLD
jgi:diguanylate cyclase (GGDEF)-like protein